MSIKPWIAFAIGFSLFGQPEELAQRAMENLGRGTIAIPQEDGKVYVGGFSIDGSLKSKLSPIFGNISQNK